MIRSSPDHHHLCNLQSTEHLHHHSCCYALKLSHELPKTRASASILTRSVINAADKKPSHSPYAQPFDDTALKLSHELPNTRAFASILPRSIAEQQSINAADKKLSHNREPRGPGLLPAIVVIDHYHSATMVLHLRSLYNSKLSLCSAHR
ncbi:hypothetical protein M0R45_001759 [Rubus argutus]|uniref:Uncharacterized protein n=1 Tax=Rubus argutus TaxID=59490 RepID=A0AAW1VFX1_RUBAR